MARPFSRLDFPTDNLLAIIRRHARPAWASMTIVQFFEWVAANRALLASLTPIGTDADESISAFVEFMADRRRVWSAWFDRRKATGNADAQFICARYKQFLKRRPRTREQPGGDSLAMISATLASSDPDRFAEAEAVLAMADDKDHALIYAIAHGARSITHAAKMAGIHPPTATRRMRVLADTLATMRRNGRLGHALPARSDR
ncbi:MAG: hypothetical protein ACK5U7_01290 [Bacteroidota bacterium]|jgi:hypothetical protein